MLDDIEIAAKYDCLGSRPCEIDWRELPLH